jgi:hypothetical protein
MLRWHRMPNVCTLPGQTSSYRSGQSANSMDVTFKLKVKTSSVIKITKTQITNTIISVTQETKLTIDTNSVTTEGEL